MNARAKFEKRIQELGQWDEWCKIGKFGRVGAIDKASSNVVILVHEHTRDMYSEFTFPPMQEMSKSDDFRKRALNEFVDAGDEEFIRNLIRWYVNPSVECPLFPLDVYFLWDNPEYKDFKDDADPEDETEEWCPHCDSCVNLCGELKVQKCPNCGKWIVPCSLCPLTNCSTDCPLERLAEILNS